MKHFFLNLLLFLTTFSFGQIPNKSTSIAETFSEIKFKKPKKIALTDNLKKCIKEKIESVETIDFTGDNIFDFICRTKVTSIDMGKEYWISSKYKIIKQKECSSDGFNYRWFINLDDDPEPEIFDATGDEDGADYTIIEQNLLTGKDTSILFFNPVIIENRKKYWGYPWDIFNIKARKNGVKTELYCSLNHNITRDGNEENDPKYQSQMPVLFFTGHHTQDSEQKNIKNEKWLTLKEIIKQTKK